MGLLPDHSIQLRRSILFFRALVMVGFAAAGNWIDRNPPGVTGGAQSMVQVLLSTCLRHCSGRFFPE